MAKFQRTLKTLSIAGIFANIWLFGFAYINNIYDLEILAIVNMILLSFTFLYEEKE